MFSDIILDNLKLLFRNENRLNMNQALASFRTCTIHLNINRVTHVNFVICAE